MRNGISLTEKLPRLRDYLTSKIRHFRYRLSGRGVVCALRTDMAKGTDVWLGRELGRKPGRAMTDPALVCC